MQLNEAQNAILIAIQSDPKALPHFDFLCTALGAALGDIDDDPERTNPFGAQARPELEEAAFVIAVAWLEAVAQAMELEEGALSAAAIDEDGIPAFVDDSALFAVADACGYGRAHLRAAFKRVRGDSPILPSRALVVLARIGRYRPEKRRASLRERSRLVHLPAGLESNELARAKAGSIFYSLVVLDGRYQACRVRKCSPARIPADGLGVISTGDVDVISAFAAPFRPADDAVQPAIEHFFHFLSERGYTYQRLVHR